MNERPNWEIELTPQERLFAIDYASHGDFHTAAKKAKITNKKAAEMLRTNGFLREYIDELLDDVRQESLITRGFIEARLLETLEEVSGNEEVSVFDKEGASLKVKVYDAKAKIAVLKEMRTLIDPSTGLPGAGARPWTSVSFETIEYCDVSSLWHSCVDYFRWADRRHMAGSAIYTLDGLLTFIKVSRSTWAAWANDRDHDFHPVVDRVQTIIDDTKYIGAVSNKLNPNIVARDLGLSEKTELSGPGGKPISLINSEMTPEEAARAYADTVNNL